MRSIHKQMALVVNVKNLNDMWSVHWLTTNHQVDLDKIWSITVCLEVNITTWANPYNVAEKWHVTTDVKWIAL